jgi:hypothetical protein
MPENNTSEKPEENRPINIIIRMDKTCPNDSSFSLEISVQEKLP